MYAPLRRRSGGKKYPGVMTGQSAKTQHSRNCCPSKHCTPCASWILTVIFPAGIPRTNGRSYLMARQSQNNAGSCPPAANGPAPIQANWFAGKKTSRNACSIWNVKRRQIDGTHCHFEGAKRLRNLRKHVISSISKKSPQASRTNVRDLYQLNLSFRASARNLLITRANWISRKISSKVNPII